MGEEVPGETNAFSTRVLITNAMLIKIYDVSTGRMRAEWQPLVARLTLQTPHPSVRRNGRLRYLRTPWHLYDDNSEEFHCACTLHHHLSSSVLPFESQPIAS